MFVEKTNTCVKQNFIVHCKAANLFITIFVGRLESLGVCNDWIGLGSLVACIGTLESLDSFGVPF